MSVIEQSNEDTTTGPQEGRQAVGGGLTCYDMGAHSTAQHEAGL